MKLLPTMLLLAGAMALAGCATATPPVDLTKLAEPSAALMTPPAEQLPMPSEACESDPVCRANTYYAPHRAQCGGFRDQTIGLQGYVHALHGTKPARSSSPRYR